LTERADEVETLLQQRDLLNEAMRQDWRTLLGSSPTHSERQAIRKEISANMEKYRAAARRLHELEGSDAQGT
jgi:hypothetical protein